MTLDVTSALCLQLRTQCKHQYDTYFGKIHLVVHEILSVPHFSLFLVMAEAAILNGQFVKNCNSFMQGLCDTILV